MGFNDNFKKLTSREHKQLKNLRKRELKEQSRDDFYTEIQFKIMEAHIKAINVVLSKHPEIGKEIVEKWKEIDIDSFFWSSDPHFLKWENET